MTPLEARWTPFIPKIKAFALFMKHRTAHANNLGHQVLALELRVHRNTVSNWARGETTPNFAVLVRIDDVARRHGFTPGGVNRPNVSLRKIAN